MAASKKKADATPAAVATPHDAVLAEAKAALADSDADRAIALLTKAIATDPKNAALLHARGAIHAIRTKEWPSWQAAFSARRKASFALAANDFDAAITLAPDYAEAYLSRGLARKHLDGVGAKEDLGRAIELGLLPTCTVQAYSARSEGSDLRIVNTMRKTRGMGHDWREDTPQLVTIRGAVPAPIVSVAPEAPSEAGAEKPPAKGDAKKSAAKKCTAPADHESAEPPRTKSGEVGWSALHRRAEDARAAAIKAAAGGAAVDPDAISRAIWLSGFPVNLRPGVRVYFEPPKTDRSELWKQAIEAVGKENAVAFAKVVVGRREPPFFYSPQYIFQAIEVLRGDTATLADCAHGFLLEVVRMDNFRYGMEHTVAALRKVVPTESLLPESVAIIEKVSASKKYKEIAQALRDWAGLVGKPSAKKKAEVAAAELALHAPTVAAFEAIVLEATTKDDLPRLRKLYAQLQKLHLLEASDHPVHRKAIEAGITLLRKRSKKAPDAVSHLLQNMLDIATDS